ncbi:MAG TPA: ABC transporter ATP-binding protein [Actinomycetaceae bacterium]|nr:ABC transporter ATP-binding protein [Actinomycetaceae bacterium]
MRALLDALRSLLPLLPSDARRFLVRYSVTASVISMLDTVAIGLMALILSAVAAGRAVSFPVIGEIPQDALAWVLAAACLLMIGKSLLNLLQQWYVTRKMADYELVIGDQLFRAYIRAPWLERMKRNSAELVRMADVGIANTTSGLLLPAASLPPEFVTFFSVLLVIVIAEPLMAVITFVYLLFVAVFLYWWSGRRAVAAGRANRDFSFRAATLMTEMVAALKEITLRNKYGEVAELVHENRTHAVQARANIQFLGAVPKFVTEAALIGGFVLVGGLGFLQGGVTQAFTSIALFGLAGFRMIPSLLRFQNVMTSTSATLPHARAVIRDIRAAESYVAEAEKIGQEPLRGEPQTLILDDVEFTYPGSGVPAVRDLDLTVPMGDHIALVGSSGAGKSTLVDLILGLITPSDGQIRLDDQDLRDVLAAWRASVGYVPQDVVLFDGTIGQNVALTWGEAYDRDRAREALARAQLLGVVEAREGGLDARVGERGLALSGGQRQRLGIARALYVDPLVLVMDEATSALDTTTEEAVTSSIRALHGEVTVITVAHRLSTIRYADLVCFMKDGTIESRGTFDQLVASNADFALQAALAGMIELPPSAE